MDTKYTESEKSIRLNRLVSRMQGYPTYDPIKFTLTNSLWTMIKGSVPAWYAKKQQISKILHNHYQAVINK